LKGEHPLIAIARSKPQICDQNWLASILVYSDPGRNDLLKKNPNTEELWQTRLSRVVLDVEPPKPPAEERRVQNEVGIGIAEAALVYKITAIKNISMPRRNTGRRGHTTFGGIHYNKPNVDLAAGHLLLRMGWA
jgi:hypothetical protein